MKNSSHPIRFISSSALLALAFSFFSANAGEVLINETFDAFSVDALPPGWTKAEPSLLSILPEEGHGKVLKLANKGEKYPFVMVTLDAAKAAGKTLNVSISAKFPGAYVPIADKLTASPKLLVEAKDAEGKVVAEAALVPQAGKPDWQELKKTVAIPANASSVTAQICIQFVACEVFFDNMAIEAVADSGPVIGTAPAHPAPVPAPVPVAPAETPKVVVAPPVAPATPPVAPTPPVPPVPPVPPAGDPNSPKVLADKAPKKSFEDGGMVFGPEYAAALQKLYPSKLVTPGTALFVGPGFVEKTLPIKLSSAWHALPFSPKLTGPSAVARALLAALPETLVKDKPEVVFISSDPTPGRKPTLTESDDWEDVARLCMRFGALPVFIPYPNETKDEQYDRLTQSVRKAVSSGNFPSVNPVPQEAFAKRSDNLLKILDTHVFLRAKAADSSKPGAGKALDE